MGLFNPAGGLSYHLKALCYYRNWTTFRSDVERWLEGWGIPKEEIILIGPSAGYTLPSRWLHTFKSRTAIDPDPLARLAFSRRFGKTNWLRTKWFKIDYSSEAGFFSLKEFKKLCHENPKAPLFFCNILGQLPVLYRNEVRSNPAAFENWKREFSSILKQRTFASFHDIFSSDRDFVLMGSDREWAGGSNIVDHQISDLFSSFSDRCYFKWPLTPQKYHLIEGVRHLAAPNS